MKSRRYGNNHIPFIADVGAYQDIWTKWWVACQPSWRKDTGLPLSKEQVENPTWERLSSCGQSGLFLVIMSTSWWATSLQSPNQRHSFEEAVDDIRWVIEQQVNEPLVPNNPVVDEGIPNMSDPTLPSWLVRKDGKRKSKESCKLLQTIS